MSDSTIRRAQGLILVVLIVSFGLGYTILRLRRRRPGFDIRTPIAAGVALRLLAVAGINSTGVQGQLRGWDENTFLTLAHHLAGTSWGTGFWPHGQYQLQTVLMAVQMKLLPLSATALRVTMIGISMLGIVLIIAAVHDLAGARPARLAAWVLALEPANIFFNSALHREPLMDLATGLVVFGGTKVWKRLDPRGALLVGLGALIGIETRSYAGWFLVVAFAVLLLIAALRKLDRPLSAVPTIYVIAVTVFLVTPTLLKLTTKQSLSPLQKSQNSSTNPAPGDTGANENNLALEKVDFSSRGAVILNLPKRMFDVTFRPYPWQLKDASQQLGAVGSIIALAGLFALIRYMRRSRGRVFALTAPFLFPFLFLMVAYALSAGNAGTGFRYRTHLVVLGAAMFAVLRSHVRAESPQSVSSQTDVIQRSLDSSLVRA